MSISSHPAETEPTLLDHWKALARIENSRARQNWDKLEPEGNYSGASLRSGIRYTLGGMRGATS